MPKFTSVARDGRGNVAGGIQVAVYDVGTTTPAPLFTDATLATPLANPVTADASGVYTFWVPGRQVRLVGVSSGVVLFDYDEVVVPAAGYAVGMTGIVNPGQSIPHNAFTQVSWANPPPSDEAGFFNPAAPTILTMPYPGWLTASIGLRWAGGVGGQRQSQLRLSGVIMRGQFLDATGTNQDVEISLLERVAAGDTLELRVFQNQTSGLALDLLATQSRVSVLLHADIS